MGRFARQLRTLIITNGLVSWWKFDEGSGSAAIDSSGNNNTGTEIGGPTYVAGKVGKYAISLNGTSQYITTSNASNFNFSASNFSLSAWINTTDASCAILSTITNSVYNGWEWCISEGSNTQAVGFVCFWNGTTWYPFNLQTVDNGVWHNIIVTYNQANMLFYLDGNFNQSISIPNPNYGNSPLYIGARNGSSILDFDGYLDDVRIYNRVLSASEVNRIYNLLG